MSRMRAGESGVRSVLSVQDTGGMEDVPTLKDRLLGYLEAMDSATGGSRDAYEQYMDNRALAISLVRRLEPARAEQLFRELLPYEQPLAECPRYSAQALWLLSEAPQLDPYPLIGEILLYGDSDWCTAVCNTLSQCYQQRPHALALFTLHQLAAHNGSEQVRLRASNMLAAIYKEMGAGAGANGEEVK